MKRPLPTILLLFLAIVPIQLLAVVVVRSAQAITVLEISGVANSGTWYTSPTMDGRVDSGPGTDLKGKTFHLSISLVTGDATISVDGIAGVHVFQSCTSALLSSCRPRTFPITINGPFLTVVGAGELRLSEPVSVPLLGAAPFGPIPTIGNGGSSLDVRDGVPSNIIVSPAFALSVTDSPSSRITVSGSGLALHQAQGMVEAPRMGTYVVRSPASENARFSYSGWVDFPDSEGYVRMDVLRRGNGEDEEKSWAIDVDRGFISDEFIVVDGQRRWLWSTGDPAPHFRSDPVSEGSRDDRFPDGGTARVRFVAIHSPDRPNESRTLLPVLDEDGIPAEPPLILADNDPTPDSFGLGPIYLNRKPFPIVDRSTSPCLDLFGCPDVQLTRAYYDSVGTNQFGRGASISRALPTLNHFIRRYFEIPSQCVVRLPGQLSDDVRAQYFNNGDLGIGRSMVCAKSGTGRGCRNETACYVKNYVAKDIKGLPNFGDVSGAFAALVSNPDAPLATVAMVSRGSMPVDAPDKVFFVVYDNAVNQKHPPLAYSAPLDNKGYNRFIPGNCLVCHGSGGSITSDSPNNPFIATAVSVKQAYFLPFDIKSFRFFFGDAGRALQETEFKRLNQFVYLTDIGRNHAAGELIRGWYGGPDFPRQTFDDNFVPQGWSRRDASRQLYRHVVAPYCQTCHISHSQDSVFDPSPLRFGTFDDFALFRGLIYSDVCVKHEMPNAEQTLKLMWGSSARPQLLSRLSLPFGCGLNTPGAGRTAVLAGAASPASAAQVFGDYKEDSCACDTRACLIAVDERFVGKFAAMRFDDPSAAEAIAVLKSEAVACRHKVAAKESALSAMSKEQMELEWQQFEQLLLDHSDPLKTR